MKTGNERKRDILVKVQADRKNNANLIRTTSKV